MFVDLQTERVLAQPVELHELSYAHTDQLAKRLQAFPVRQPRLNIESLLHKSSFSIERSRSEARGRRRYPIQLHLNEDRVIIFLVAVTHESDEVPRIVHSAFDVLHPHRTLAV